MKNHEQVLCDRCGKDISDRLEQHGALRAPVCWTCWQNMDEEAERAEKIEEIEAEIASTRIDISMLNDELRSRQSDLDDLEAKLERLEENKPTHVPVSPNQMRLWA